jgi:hypothetical protein
LVSRRAVLVAGTHAWRDITSRDWYSPGSWFALELERLGVSPVFAPDVFGSGRRVGFVWSTDVGGVGFGSGDLAVWQAAGIQLFWWCVPPWCPEARIPPDELLVIAHSHGVQPALWAFALGLRGRLLSIGSPIRKDMLPIAERARPNIARWVHVHSDGSDNWQWLGALFDGRIGVYRQHPLADVNRLIPKVGHSEILRDPTQFHHWPTILADVWPAAADATGQP